MVDPSVTSTNFFLRPEITILSNIYTTSKLYDKSFLHQKYIVETLSLRQIGALIFSSKTAVRNALIRFDIPLREKKTPPERHGNPPYGIRRVGGKNIVHKQERRVIESIVKMKDEGLSNRAIARILNELKTPTKKQGKGWHHEQVRQILLRVS